MRASEVRLDILILAVLLAPLPATAADLPVATKAPVVAVPVIGPVNPFYLSLHGGVGWLQDTTLDYVNGAAPNRNVMFDAGWAISGAAGYQFSPWWRSEIEFGGRGSSVMNSSPGTGPGGSAQANTLMLNGYLDIPNQTPITPYVGAGFGKAWVTHNLTFDGAPLSQNNTSMPWAWQVMAGANYVIAPRWTVGAEYRYISTQSGLFTDVNGLFYNANYNSHSFLLGVTWRPL